MSVIQGIQNIVRSTRVSQAGGSDILGFSFDSSANARLRGDFTTIDRRELTSNLQRRGSLVRDFLAGSDD